MQRTMTIAATKTMIAAKHAAETAATRTTGNATTCNIIHLAWH